MSFLTLPIGFLGGTAVGGGGGGGSSPVTGFTGWWRADSGLTLLGSDVLQWNDRSTIPKTMNPTSAGSRPTRLTAGIASQPTLQFNAADVDNLQGGALSNFIVNSAYTLYAVINPRGASRNFPTYYSNNGVVAASGSAWGLNMRGSTPPQLQMGHTDTIDRQIDLNITYNTPILAIARFGSNTLGFRLNNNTETTVATTGNISSLTGTFRFALGSNNFSADVDIAEVIIYNTRHSNADVATNQAYVQAQYPGLF